MNSLQETSLQYIRGDLDADQFKSVLGSAFGSKLPQILPLINAGLPTGKQLY